jgi:hypothetical protein
MTLANLRRFESGQFMWEGRSAHADASDLGIPPGQQPVDFLVRSSRTGSSLRFAFYNHEFVDGDLTETTYCGVADGKYVFVRIYND